MACPLCDQEDVGLNPGIMSGLSTRSIIKKMLENTGSKKGHTKKILKNKI